MFGLLAVLSLGAPLSSRELFSREPGLEGWLRRVGPDAFGDHEAIRRLGALYLVAYPEDRDLARLRRLLVGDGAAQIQRRLVEGIARDWREHDVTVIAGWVFARTEARLCAVIHMMGDGWA